MMEERHGRVSTLLLGHRLRRSFEHVSWSLELRTQKKPRFFFFDPSWDTSTSLCSGCSNTPTLASSSASSEISCAGSEGVWLWVLSIVDEGFSCCSKFAILSSNSLTAASCVRFSSSRISVRSFLSIASFSECAFSSRILALSSSDLRFSSRRLDSSSHPVFGCWSPLELSVFFRLVHLDDSHC